MLRAGPRGRAGVSGWEVGDQACALLSGGGYAEKVVVPAAQLLPIPEGVSFTDAGALPEVACTVWSNVVLLGGLRSGQTFLVHGAAAGSGRTRSRSGRRWVRRCWRRRVTRTGCSAANIGADHAIDYRGDFVEEVKASTTGSAPT